MRFKEAFLRRCIWLQQLRLLADSRRSLWVAPLPLEFTDRSLIAHHPWEWIMRLVLSDIVFSDLWLSKKLTPHRKETFDISSPYSTLSVTVLGGGRLMVREIERGIELWDLQAEDKALAIHRMTANVETEPMVAKMELISSYVEEDGNFIVGEVQTIHLG